MKLVLRVRGGALIGRTFEFDEGPVRVGRQPGLELSLDPAEDLAASGLHAEIRRTPEGWFLHDLGSRNGTWVDGKRIRSVIRLESGMRITFGSGGPEVEATVGDDPGPGATTRVRVAVTREARKSRKQLALLMILAVSALAVLLVRDHRKEAAWGAERREILAAADRALAVEGFDPSRWVEATTEGSIGGDDPLLEGELRELSEALDEARAEVRALREGLRSAVASSTTPDPGEEDLRRRLQVATAALSRHQLAGSLDLPAIREANVRAVALVHVQSAAGVVSTGTAFAVRPDGLLVTVRHLVLPDPEAPLPARIGIQFANSSQVFPGRIVASSEDFDLAAVRVENVLGGVPVVRGLNLRPDTLGTGAPVASLGFPLGGEMEAVAGEDRPVARPLLTAGVLERVTPGTLEIHGYGRPGASGSPIFDAAGSVVGILYGGRAGTPEQILLAVNGIQIHRFLERVP